MSTPRATLSDGTQVWCLVKSEAIVLDHHIHGYFGHGLAPTPGAIVFDVGANIGLYGVRANQRCGGDITVYAFEPVPPTYAVLARNFVDANNPRLRAMPFGLSKAAGRFGFTHFPHTPALSTGHPEAWDEDPSRFVKAVRSNLENPPPELWWARYLPGFMAGLIAAWLRAGAEKYECELRTLSQFLREENLAKIDLLKVDAEGAELDVLLGIEAADWPKIGAVVAEVHDLEGRLDTVKALLIQHGFQIEVEQERGMEETGLYNVYARRPGAAVG